MGLIRCDHCGWSNNPEDATRCQKCNQELIVPIQAQSLDMLETVKMNDCLSECKKCGYPISAEVSVCPNCGFSVQPVRDASHKPKSEAAGAMKATVRDISVPSQSVLKKTIPLGGRSHSSHEKSVGSVEQEQQARKVRPFNETIRIDDVHAPAVTKKIFPDTALFRLRPLDMDVPESFAFGTDTNASFEYDDGQWYIADGSGTDSTFVCASRRIALEKGDVVVIGGRRYRFE